MECDDCGTTEGVHKTVCPYELAIYDVEEEAYLCDECEYQRAGCV